MNLTTLPSFELTGLHIHTTWHNNQAKADIAKLWKRFYAEDIANQLDFSVDDTVYLLYTDYSHADNHNFSVWLGLQTLTEDPLPIDLRRLLIPSLSYYQFDIASELPEDVRAVWQQVHLEEAQLNRLYRCDIECYPDNEYAQLFVSTSDETVQDA